MFTAALQGMEMRAKGRNGYVTRKRWRRIVSPSPDSEGVRRPSARQAVHFKTPPPENMTLPPVSRVKPSLAATTNEHRGLWQGTGEDAR